MDKRRMCPHCRAFITTSDKTCPYCNEQVAPRAVDRRSPNPIGGFIPQVRFNTIIILVINFGLYLATSLFSMNSGRGNAMTLDGQTLVDFGAMFVPLIKEGEWWRLVTAGFLHGGLLHILMNSWVLFDLGAQVEEMYGASRMLVIYFVSNVCGFYLSSLFSPGLSIGASAAACGLIGAMIALGLRDRTGFGAAIRAAYIRWAVYMLIISVMIKGIDLAAHVGGLVGGFALAYLAGEPRYEGSATEKLWRISSFCCILLTIASFLKMYLWFSHNAQ
jgi:rhomboid protease GluP